MDGVYNGTGLRLIGASKGTACWPCRKGKRPDGCIDCRGTGTIHEGRPYLALFAMVDGVIDEALTNRLRTDPLFALKVTSVGLYGGASFTPTLQYFPSDLKDVVDAVTLPSAGTGKRGSKGACRAWDNSLMADVGVFISSLEQFSYPELTGKWDEIPCEDAVDLHGFSFESSSTKCQNKREGKHGSSTVYFTVTRAGVHQRCFCKKDRVGAFSVTCRDFRSDPVPLPTHLHNQLFAPLISAELQIWLRQKLGDDVKVKGGRPANTKHEAVTFLERGDGGAAHVFGHRSGWLCHGEAVDNSRALANYYVDQAVREGGNNTGKRGRDVQEAVNDGLLLHSYNREEGMGRYILPADKHVLFVVAQKGQGKTNALVSSLKSISRDTAALVVTHRCSLAAKLHGDLADGGFAHYKHVSWADGVPDRLVVQLDSLWRIEADIPKFKVVVLDEVESLLRYASSRHIQRRTTVMAVLRALIRSADTVYALDALPSVRSVEFLAGCRDEGAATIHIHENTHCKHKDDTYVAVPTSKAFIAKLEACVGAGQRIGLVCLSAKVAKREHHRLKEMFPDKRGLLYTGDTKESRKQNELANVDREWKGADWVIFTPTITAGISCTLPFDAVFAYGCKGSAGPMDFHQMIQRFRNVTSHQYFVYLENMGTTIRKTTPVTYKDAENALTLPHCMVDGIPLDPLGPFEISEDGVREFVCRDTPQYRLEIQNMREWLDARNRFARVFWQVAGEMRASVRVMLPEERATDEENAPSTSALRREQKDSDAEQIAVAGDIFIVDADRIMNAVDGGEDVSTDEMAELKRFQLRRSYSYDGEITRKWVKRYDSPAMKRAFFHLCQIHAPCGRISSGMLARLREAERARARDIDIVRCEPTLMKHRFALQLLRSFGFDPDRGPFDTDTVRSREEVQHALASDFCWLNRPIAGRVDAKGRPYTEFHLMRDTFKTRSMIPVGGIGSRSGDIRYCLGMLNCFIRKAYGVEVAGTGRRHRLADSFRLDCSHWCLNADDDPTKPRVRSMTSWAQCPPVFVHLDDQMEGITDPGGTATQACVLQQGRKRRRGAS